MELRQVEYVVAVAEHLHFGHAAEALSVGQPAVSQQVARLERELGVKLFDRTARTVRLTEVGERFLPEARAVLAAVARAREVAVPGVPTLRIGSSTGLGSRLAVLLRELDTTTVLTSAPTQTRLDQVASGVLDAAFVRGVTSAAGVELIDVWRDRLLVALPATHALARADQDVVELADLASMPVRIVARRRNPPLVDLVLGACARAGFSPVPLANTDGLENTLAALVAGPPSWTVVYEAHARTLRLPDVAFRRAVPELTMTTAIAVPAEATSRALAPLLRACAVAADAFS